MSLPPLRTFASEAACRAHFKAVYCVSPIATFDAILVRFRKSDFDHCFFESSKREASRIHSPHPGHSGWTGSKLRFRIPPRTSMLVGTKTPSPTPAAAVVSGNYVVVIAITGTARANFITAYLADTPRTLQMIRKSPRWS